MGFFCKGITAAKDFLEDISIQRSICQNDSLANPRGIDSTTRWQNIILRCRDSKYSGLRVCHIEMRTSCWHSRLSRVKHFGRALKLLDKKPKHLGVRTCTTRSPDFHEHRRGSKNFDFVFPSKSVDTVVAKLSTDRYFFWKKLTSTYRYRIVMPEELVSITETDLWECQQKISHYGYRFSLEFQLINSYYRYRFRAEN